MGRPMSGLGSPLQQGQEVSSADVAMQPERKLVSFWD